MEEEDGKRFFLTTSSKEVSNTDLKSTSVAKVVSFMVSPISKESSCCSTSQSDEVMKLNYNISEELISNKSLLSRTETRSTGTEGSARVKSSSFYVENLQEVNQEVNEELETARRLDEYRQRISDAENTSTGREYSVQSSSGSYVAKCVPPWATSVRKRYGMPLSGLLANDYETEEAKQKHQEKIESLMKKHSDLMLVKRVESRKQFIFEPSKSYGQMEAIKMRAKNTRYYMAPLVKGDEKQFIGEKKFNDLDHNKNTSLEIPNSNYINKVDSTKMNNRNGSLESVLLPDYTDSMSITKKTSKSKAKKEMSNVIKMLKISNQKSDETKQNYTVRKEQAKCPKITLSKIREFVNAQAMDPNERKLQEIIKIEKIPTPNAQDKGKPGSKYTVIVPREKSTDIGSVNVIKIKEKRKLRLQSIKDINEKVTELHYSQGSPRRQRKHDEYTMHHTLDDEDEHTIRKRIKTPTELKTFEVTSRRSPRIAPLVGEGEKTDKVLLIQYDKKTKQGKSKVGDENGQIRTTTQLLGINKQERDGTGEMYLYGAKTDGRRITENVTKVEDVSPTLKDKVHSIFEELKEMALKIEAKPELITEEMQAGPAVSTQSTQRPSHPQAMTEEAMVQAVPDSRSAEVQVQVRHQLSAQEELELPKAPPSTLASGQLPVNRELSSVDQLAGQLSINRELSSVDQLAGQLPINRELSLVDQLAGQLPINRELSSVDQTVEEMIYDLAGMDTFDAFPEAVIKEERPEEGVVKDEFKSEDNHFKDDVMENDFDKEVTLKIDTVENGQRVQEIETLEKTDQVEYETEAHPSTTDTNETRTTKGVTFGKKTSYEDDAVTLTFTEPGSKMDLAQAKPEGEEEQKPDKIFRESAEAYLLLQESEIKMEPHVRLSKSKKSLERSSRGVDQALFISEIEDIRSYELDPHQGTELRIKSSSKFIHKKESIRKNMNWTEDSIYLEKHTCPKLIQGLAVTAVRRPSDPISFLAHWIYKDYHNREREERQDVGREHLELTRTMVEVGAQRHEEIKKFNIRKYPAQEIVDKDWLEGEPPEDTAPETVSAQ